MSGAYELIKTLTEKGLAISTCESCTGGLLAAALTDVPGASAVYTEGAVTYSNEAKVRLGVDRETLKKFGAVSRETALEMARAIKNRSGAHIGIATTGIAGPGGGTCEKPVGLVFAAMVTPLQERVLHLSLTGSREQIRQETVKKAIDTILEILQEV